MRKLYYSVPALFFALMTPTALAANATLEEYNKQAAKEQLERNPQNHKNMADWCKRRYPEKYQFHLNAWQTYDFGRLEKLLPAEPSIADLLRMKSTAEKMGFQSKELEYREKWGKAQFPEFARKLKPGNTVMMKQLLDWVIKEKVDGIPDAQELAKNITVAEPEYEPAHRTLKQLKLAKGWMTLEEALSSIDVQNARERLEIHKAMAAYRPIKEVSAYPADPTRGMETVIGNGFRTATAKSGGKAVYFIWTREYRRSKPCALVIDLHGGGEGGFEKSLAYASTHPYVWENNAKEGSWVVISPTVQHHVANSWWNKDNLEDVFDMMDETVERFNIDRKRIYVTGQSMGGNGAGEWMWAFPELAAASCSRAGAYWTGWLNMKDILGKPILVIHGEKDLPGRNQTRDLFIQKTEELGGVVTHISYPDVDHFIQPKDIYPKMIPYFLSHVNDIEPDFDLLREVFRDRHRKHPQPYDK